MHTLQERKGFEKDEDKPSFTRPKSPNLVKVGRKDSRNSDFVHGHTTTPGKAFLKG